ncbi:hypothetical protein PHLGIDRAFT_29042 [Phlebiopsis gigantea 11061_1 CR5-6]|uniref:NADAR domain-containing protein n=1 Tax=Phlebiopsis gigantea (strain 11061_1 CR5-6) TaxID=745531 RepID=A0A0C3PQM1_PHLG1|nr:hypothetical protein PHLGIDRAFT_29042 [Phlebiopsis gigantea 11061_1 CR5-6]
MEEPHYYDAPDSMVSHVPEGFSRERVVEAPIRFYHRHQQYYEFTNFANYAVSYNGRRYPTGEHLFQAFKFMDTNPRLAEHIRGLRSPREALREATRLRSQQRSDWFDVNVGFMEIILRAKFSQHPYLRRKLLDTGNRELLEDSPVDSFWGIGADGQGSNELGKALMRVRDEIRVEIEREGVRGTAYTGRDRDW